MVFSSITFLIWFMPVFFLAYYAVPDKLKNIVLFIGSIIFYAWGEPKYLLLLIASILVNYVAGLCINKFNGKKKTFFFVIAIAFDILMLFFFKYINFTINNINSLFGFGFSNVDVELPLGISFYTFQIMSYVIDLYKGKIKVEKSFVKLGAYLCMFPQLIAGPIVVYEDISARLYERKITLDAVEDGLKTFIIGLGAKVIIANNVGALWDDIVKIGFDAISMPMALLGMVAFSLQIYFDFNGYSIMAIGLGKMLGFDFKRNFNHPYISRSITEYWRRWHITLSSWFREYVYIPLGGNRKGRLRTYVNLFIVWLLTGMWHGAEWNFILWGMYFYVFLMLEKNGFGRFLEKNKVFSRLYSLIVIGIGWIIFAINDLSELGMYLRSFFCGGFDGEVFYYIRNYGLILIVGIIFSTELMSKLYERIREKALSRIICIILFVVSVCYLADATYNPFLYFRF